MTIWTQPITPLNNSLGLSALVAVIPILVMFYVLAVKRWKGYQAIVLTLILAIALANLVYKMPLSLIGTSTVFGMLNGLFPIGWIVFSAVLLYNLTVESGHFTVVKDVIASLTEDRRLQALLIGFCFGAFLEGSAGFGAPVAITAGLLVGLGFQPLYAAGLCLIANTAPVAFGGIGIAIITAGKVSDIDPMIISKMVAHQLPLLAFMVPFWLVVIMSGWKGLKEVLPAVFITGFSYALTMYLTASYMGPFLPDILSSLVSIVCLVLFLRVWKPKNIWRFPGEAPIARTHKKYTTLRQLQAWTPFLLMIVFVANWGMDGVKNILAKQDLLLHFRGLDKHIISAVSGKPISAIYNFSWASAAGTAILFATILSIIFLRIPLKQAVAAFKHTVKELAFPMLTIACVLGFAYVANNSGMTITLGKVLTLAGAAFPFLSPFLGWLGVFVTGSDTSSNALFGKMQRVTAEQIGVNPVLTVAANTSGGVAAKMISPQSIAVAAAAVGIEGQEGKLFAFTVKHSLAFVAIIGVITYLQAYYLKGMVPSMVSNKAAVATVVGGNITSSLWISGIILLILLIAGRMKAGGPKGAVEPRVEVSEG